MMRYLGNLRARALAWLVTLVAVLPQWTVRCDGHQVGVRVPDSVAVDVWVDGGCGYCHDEVVYYDDYVYDDYCWDCGWW
jgi:hypothetical protein